MTIFDDVGNAEAKAEEAEASAFGETVSFKHRVAASVTLKVNVGEENITPVETDGGIVKERIREFRVPIQTGFAVSTDDTEPVIPGDTLTYNSRIYSVKDPIIKTSHDRIYVLTCVQQKTLSRGVS